MFSQRSVGFRVVSLETQQFVTEFLATRMEPTDLFVPFVEILPRGRALLKQDFVFRAEGRFLSDGGVHLPSFLLLADRPTRLQNEDRCEPATGPTFLKRIQFARSLRA